MIAMWSVRRKSLVSCSRLFEVAGPSAAHDSLANPDKNKSQGEDGCRQRAEADWPYGATLGVEVCRRNPNPEEKQDHKSDQANSKANRQGIPQAIFSVRHFKQAKGPR